MPNRDSSASHSVKRNTATITPTAEQSAILCSIPSSSSLISPRVIRITAAAGTGKTTTLEMISQQLLLSNHTILYAVFNKDAQLEAESRFGRSLPENLCSNLECCTIHSAALRYGNSGLLGNIKFEKAVTKEIAKAFRNEIQMEFIIDNEYVRSSDKNALVDQSAFWIHKTLEGWMRKETDENSLDYNDFYTYYPIKVNDCLKHRSKFGKDPGMFYVRMARRVWAGMWDGSGRFSVTHDAYTKYAQLNRLMLGKFDVILLDESQDATLCQLDAFVKQQVVSPPDGKRKLVIIVGDSAQCIYSFRGAKPKFVAELDKYIDESLITDFSLTKSFRFGEEIATAANKLLFIKEHSPQSNTFLHYRVIGASPIPGEIVENEMLPYPFTIIARTSW